MSTPLSIFIVFFLQFLLLERVVTKLFWGAKNLASYALCYNIPVNNRNLATRIPFKLAIVLYV